MSDVFAIADLTEAEIARAREWVDDVAAPAAKVFASGEAWPGVPIDAGRTYETAIPWSERLESGARYRDGVTTCIGCGEAFEPSELAFKAHANHHLRERDLEKP